MLKILILEDDPIRHIQFNRNFQPHYIEMYDNAEEVIMALKHETWDMLFLDHDLGGEVMVDSGPNTGYGVACWLEQHPDKIPKHVLIHSLNPIGSLKMQQAIKGSHLTPNIWIFPIQKIIDELSK